MVFSLLLIALLIISAFAVDLGFARQQARHLQGAVDASALAGAQELPNEADDDTSLQAARNVAFDLIVSNLSDDGNYPEVADCGDENPCTRTVRSGTGDDGGGTPHDVATVIVTAPYSVNGPSTAHNFVKVEVCRDSPTFFGQFAGQNGPRNVCREAVARRVVATSTYGTGLLTLSPDACGAMSFTGSGETDLVISGSKGAVLVNSNCEPNALDGGGKAWEVEAGEILVVGGYSISPCSEVGCLGGVEPVTGVQPFLDPFADLPVPSKPDAAGGCSAGVCTPGHYSSGLSINNGAYTFQPGLYWIDGDLKFTGGQLTAPTPGVTFFINSGAVDIRGNAQLNLPPPSTEPYAGISIYQPASNVSEAKLNGGSNSSIGTVYLPGAHLQIQGDASPADGPFVTGSVVADTVEVTGNGLLTIFVPDDVAVAVSEPDLGLEQ